MGHVLLVQHIHLLIHLLLLHPYLEKVQEQVELVKIFQVVFHLVLDHVELLQAVVAVGHTQATLEMD